MDFRSGAELLELCEKESLSISQVMRRREWELGETTPEETQERMIRALEIMRASATGPVREPGRSMGGLIGGEAKRLFEHRKAGESICGEEMSLAMTYAVAVLEVSASMGVIVAAPTAGSAGVVPGVLLALQQCRGLSDERVIDALFNAGAVGYLAMRNATVAGAVGGSHSRRGGADGGNAPAEFGRGLHRADEHAGAGV